MVACAYNSNTGEAEAGKEQAQGQPELCSEFHVNLIL